MDWKLALTFTDSINPELITTEFSCPLIPEPVTGVRAQYPGRNAVSKKWQKATIALTALMIRVKLRRMSGDSQLPILMGGKGSLAKTLANQLYIPTSSSDLFGFRCSTADAVCVLEGS